MLRFLIIHPTVVNYCLVNCSLFTSVINSCCEDGGDTIALLMTLRMIANFTSNDRGAHFFVKTMNLVRLLEILLVSATNETCKQYSQLLQAIVSILHNISPFMNQKKTLASEQAIGIIVLILSKPELVEGEGFNLLMALGNLLYGNKELKEEYSVLVSNNSVYLDQWRNEPKNTPRIVAILRDIDSLLEKKM